MNWNRWIRQTHRWIAVIFTITVIAGFAAAAQQPPVEWVLYLPLPPLAVLLFSGLYLFVLPHATRWRSRRRTSRATDPDVVPTGDA